MKREPLLVDKILSFPYGDNSNKILPKPFWETTRSNLQLAKRFVFDTQATEYCASLIREEPRIIADAQDFAIAPFDRTYIEIDFTSWYRTVTGNQPDANADTRLGYLIVKNEVRVLAESPNGAAISPIVYNLNKPFSYDEELKSCEFLGISRMQLDVFYWGESSFKKLQKTEWQKEGIRSLRANHSFSIALSDKKVERFYESSAGDLRNIIALLLFMNRTSKTRYEKQVPMLPGKWIGRKQSTFLKHKIISFSVNPIPKLIKLSAGESIKRRLHDVRGHLCHNFEARTNHHDHDWIESTEKHMHWYCACGGVRWWRKSHVRGYEEQGIVTSEYKVTD